MNLELFKYVASALLGAAITLVAFRTKLALMQRQIKAQNEVIRKNREDIMAEIARSNQELRDSITQINNDIKERHQENKQSQQMLDRRSLFTLRLVADVARKLGVDSRVDDTVIGFLTEHD